MDRNRNLESYFGLPKICFFAERAGGKEFPKRMLDPGDMISNSAYRRVW
jgi:hypothetical protein